MVRGIQVVVDKPSYKRFGHSIPESVHLVMMDGLADTGAQMIVISSGMAQRLGVRISEMMPISMNITTRQDKTRGFLLVSI